MLGGPGACLLEGRGAPTGVDLEILQLTNDYRAEFHLEGLQWHTGLALIARRHAIAVAEGREPFSHAGARERFAACRSHCINVAENLARSDGFDRPDIAKVIVQGWIESEGHRRNLIGPFNVCGLGWAASDHGPIFVTQLFAYIDEHPTVADKLKDVGCQVATSTPALLAAVGYAAVSTSVAVGLAVVGTAVDQKLGFRAANLPALARAKMGRLLRKRLCASCGCSSDELFLAGDGRLVCEACHPQPAGDDVWCFID